MAEELGQQRLQVQTRIDTLNREARSLLDVIKKSGGKGSRTITERLGELESEMDKFRQEAGRLDDQIPGLTESVGRVATAIELLDSFDDLWDALIPEERVELLRLLIDHIDVDEPAGKLELHLHDLAAPFPRPRYPGRNPRHGDKTRSGVDQRPGSAEGSAEHGLGGAAVRLG